MTQRLSLAAFRRSIFAGFLAFIFVFFACSGDSATNDPLSSSSSSDGLALGASSSSSAREYAFCVYADLRVCINGPATVCLMGGRLSNDCPSYFDEVSSSSLAEVSSSSEAVQLHEYCVYENLRECLHGPVAVCPGGGVGMDTCPEFPPVSSSSGDVVVDGSSSSVQLFDFCVYNNLRECLEGPVAVCPGGGIPSNSCPDFPPVAVSSSSSEAVVVVSSSSKEKFARCVYESLKVCIEGPAAVCLGGGVLSNDPCPYSPPVAVSSSSGEVVVSSSSGEGEVSSSSSEAVSSSSREKFNYCVYESFKVCIPGPVSKCQTGGVLSNECPDFRVPGDDCEDEYNDYETFRSRSYYCSDGILREYGSLLDVRDGQRYKTVVIGDDEWMAENFKYMPVSGTTEFGDPIPVGSNRCYGVAVSEAGNVTDSYECNLLGRYYNWGTVMDLPVTTPNCNSNTAAAECVVDNNLQYQGICPEDWHVPTRQDFEGLMQAAGGPGEAYYSLKARGQWKTFEATDKFGFSLLAHAFLGLVANVPQTTSVSCILAESTSPLQAFIWSSEKGTTNYSNRFTTGNTIEASGRTTATPLRCVRNR